MESNVERLSKAFIASFESMAQECQRLCYSTRARELQEALFPRIVTFQEQLAGLKRDAVACADEESANMLLSFEELTEALIAELSMWIALKQEEPADAWRHLVHAQLAARHAIQAHHMGTVFNAPRYMQRLLLLEQFLFPPQGFLSIGAVIEYAECSICGQEYGTCDHLVDKVYMGEFCIRRVIHARLREVSIVPEPANKTCRILAIPDNQGVLRDTMTWRDVPVTTPQAPETPTAEEIRTYFEDSDAPGGGIALTP